MSPIPLRPKETYVFGIHPHGIHSWPVPLFTFGGSPLHRRFPGLRRIAGIAATVIFYVPFARELLLTLGFRDARRSSAERILREGRSLMLIPGGSAEAVATRTGTEMVYLLGRMGFVR